MYIKTRRKDRYIDTQLQFKQIVFSVVFISVEAFLMACFVHYVFQVEKNIATLYQGVFVYFTLLGIFLLSVFINTIVVIRFTHKIAGPIYAFKKALRAINRGFLPGTVLLRENDLLSDFENEFNTMLEKLKTINDECIKKNNFTESEIKRIQEEIAKMSISQKSRKMLNEFLNNITNSCVKLGFIYEKDE